jgi:hypothetical protein
MMARIPLVAALALVACGSTSPPAAGTTPPAAVRPGHAMWQDIDAFFDMCEVYLETHPGYRSRVRTVMQRHHDDPSFADTVEAVRKARGSATRAEAKQCARQLAQAHREYRPSTVGADARSEW